MLLYRLIKQEFFMNREFRKYVWYAVGEIALVVVGIIIALQIDTWYENRQTHERLDDYLENIAKDIADDLQRIEALKIVRSDTIFEAFSTRLTALDPEVGYSDQYNAGLTAAASEAIEKAQRKLYFVASAGSYRALESSGLMRALSDTEIQFRLSDYYRTVDRIAHLEQDMNTTVGELSLRFQTELSANFPRILFDEPLLLWQGDVDIDEQALEMFRRQYWEILDDSITHALLRTATNQLLLQEYEHLLSLGKILVDYLGGTESALATNEIATKIYSTDNPTAHPVLIEDGRPGYHSYGLFIAPTNSKGLSQGYTGVWIEDDALNVRYTGGDPWVYLYFKYGPSEIAVQRYSHDYSAYDRMQLTLRRDHSTECSSLLLEIKDIDDAERGDLRNVPLLLTPDWQTYTVGLDEFVDADLTRLNVTAGFLFVGPEPCRIAIRDIRYLRPE